jgi:hypothetical protein
MSGDALVTAGGIYDGGESFKMSGGTISQNKAGDYGGGGCVKIGEGSAIIYDNNTALEGSVAYVITKPDIQRYVAAGPDELLDSTKEGAAGGWEYPLPPVI